MRALRWCGRAVAVRYRAAPRGLFWGWGIALVAYLLVLAITHELKPGFVAGAAILMLCCYWNRWTQGIIGGATPFLAQGIVYELSGVFGKWHGPVHIEGPYVLERTLFGIPTASGVVTPNELFAVHHWPVVDLILGSSYILYIYEVLAFMFFLFFTRHHPGRAALHRRFGCAFFAMSVTGYLIYHLFPAAPPWYVTDHGFAAPTAHVLANPAGALRWDAITGIPYFHHFYKLTTDIFGAMPSLHVAYAVLVFVYVIEVKKRWLTVAAGALCGSMCLAAVYLQHHYVIDVLAGAALALTAWALDRIVLFGVNRAAAREERALAAYGAPAETTERC